jgi:hypothetical protein
MAIHENLTRIPKQQLREVCWDKATELVKVARKEGGKFDCPTWLHKARELPKEGFKVEVEQRLTANKRSLGGFGTLLACVSLQRSFHRSLVCAARLNPLA